MGKSRNSRSKGNRPTSSRMNDWIRAASGYGQVAAVGVQPEAKRTIPTANAANGARSVVDVPVNVNLAMNEFIRNRGQIW